MGGRVDVNYPPHNFNSILRVATKERDRDTTPHHSCFSSEAARPLQLRSGSGLAGKGRRKVAAVTASFSPAAFLPGPSCLKVEGALPLSLSLSLSLSLPCIFRPQQRRQVSLRLRDPPHPPPLLPPSLPLCLRAEKRARFMAHARARSLTHSLPRCGFQPFSSVVVGYAADKPSLPCSLAPAAACLPACQAGRRQGTEILKSNRIVHSILWRDQRSMH